MIPDVLDVPDNLERAAASVPGELPDDPEKLKALLKGLLEGVKATERIMLQVVCVYLGGGDERGGSGEQCQRGADSQGGRGPGFLTTRAALLSLPSMHRCSGSRAWSSTTRLARSSTPTCTARFLRSQMPQKSQAPSLWSPR